MSVDPPMPLSPLDAIREKLRGYPQLSVVDAGDAITVKAAAAGFDVSLHCGDGEYIVCMEGWHAHFDSTQIDTALNCFALGLSDAARLRVHSRGGKDYRWTLETYEDDAWRADSTTGLLFFPFWRNKTVRYLRNAVIVTDTLFTRRALMRHGGQEHPPRVPRGNVHSCRLSVVFASALRLADLFQLRLPPHPWSRRSTTSTRWR